MAELPETGSSSMEVNFVNVKSEEEFQSEDGVPNAESIGVQLNGDVANVDVVQWNGDVANVESVDVVQWNGDVANVERVDVVQLNGDVANVESAADVEMKDTVANVEGDDVQMQPSRWPRVAELQKIVTVEVIIFFYAYGHALVGPTMQALVYRKVCLGLFNVTVCDNLNKDEYKDEEDQVQSDAARWYMAENVCFEVPAILLCTLYGSLSDNLSRKAAILLPVIGQIISTSNYVINSVYMDLPVGFILFGPFISGVFGGSVTAGMACFSYLSEITSTENRTVRIAIAEGTIYVSAAISVFFGGKLLDSTSYAFMISLALGMYVLTALYTLVWIREPPSLARTGRKNCGAIWRKVINPKAIKAALVCVFKKRQRSRRTHILVSLSVLITGSVGVHAGSLTYLFVRRQPLNWTQTRYGYFSGCGYILHIISMVVILPILRILLHVRDTYIITMALVSMSLSMVLFAFSTRTWMVFLTPLLGMLGALYGVILRSMLSKMVEKDELGRVFAVFAAIQSLNGLIGSLLYNNLYPATLDWWNGFCFMMGAVICIIPISLNTWLGRDLKKYGWDSYGTLQEDVAETRDADGSDAYVNHMQETDGTY